MLTMISGPVGGTPGRSAIKVEPVDATGLVQRVARMAESRQSFGFRAKKKFLEKVVARTVLQPHPGGRHLHRPQIDRRAAALVAKLPGMRGGVLDFKL